ncbi:MAG: hypothetical protein PUK59_05800 [Actinomycetaceae bacterium]|nr:hypothetical protein [Actinomycetaceae bacterium]
MLTFLSVHILDFHYFAQPIVAIALLLAALPHAQELQDRLETTRENPQIADKVGDVELPDFTETTFDVNFSDNVDADTGDADGAALLPQLTDSLRTADVTNIVEHVF